ncbi:VOC family protein [Nonomuraea sp. NPDC003709]|uniref:VOC family protein n=1 Tax=Nonomuraea sp. NPDC003709 TaxID=3154450 RepID=UPI0033B1CED4
MSGEPATGMLHHVEIWVPDLPRAVASWQWLLETLGYTLYQDWEHGRSWRLGATYLVLEQSPALSADRHDRCRPGLNHLAFHVGSRAEVDALAERAPANGWTLMFPDRPRTRAGSGTTRPIWRMGTASRSSWSRSTPQGNRRPFEEPPARLQNYASEKYISVSVPWEEGA